MNARSNSTTIPRVAILDEHVVAKCVMCPTDGGPCTECGGTKRNIVSIAEYESDGFDKSRAMVVVDEPFLRNLADVNNARSRTGDYCPAVIGHTMPGLPEEQQPPVVGWYQDYFVSDFLFDDGCNRWVKALFASQHVYDEYLGDLKKYPRRSVEINFESGKIDPIALLGATTPARDLGWVAYQENEKKVVYEYSCQDQLSTNNKSESILLTEEWKYLCKLYQEASPGPGSVYQPRGIEKMSEPAIQAAQDFGAIQKQLEEQIKALETENQALKNKLSEACAQYKDASRRSTLKDLSNDYELDVEEEMQSASSSVMDDSLFDKHVSRIKSRYSKRKVHVKPGAVPVGIEDPEPDPKPPHGNVKPTINYSESEFIQICQEREKVLKYMAANNITDYTVGKKKYQAEIAGK